MGKQLIKLSVLLAIVLSTILIVKPVGVKAITRSDAIAWLRAQENRKENCDVDGNGLWCTDLATAWVNYLWLKTNGDSRSPWGKYPYTTQMAHAYDDAGIGFLNGNVNWTIITRTSSTVPQPGDLFVSETDDLGAGTGHVGIVLEAHGSTSADIIEMAGGKKPYIRYNVSWGCSPSYNAQHLIRFNYYEKEPDPVVNYEIDLNWTLDGTNVVDASAFATADVYINGKLIASNVSDYWGSWPVGTTYEFKNVKVNPGYNFLGLVSGKQSGTLGTSHVECRFGFERLNYEIDLNWTLDGVNVVDASDFATADVYINGKLIASSVTDYWGSWPLGTTYEIKNVKVKSGYKFLGLISGKQSGTLGASHVECRFGFKTEPKYGINLNWQLNGENIADAEKFATADVYINGTLVASGVTDYYGEWPTGTTYKFVVNAKKGYKKIGVISGKESGTLSSESVECKYSFKSIHSLTVFGYIDEYGSIVNTNTSIEGYGTFDVYINGKAVATAVTRYYNDSLEYGTQYSIENIKMADKMGYSGIYTEDGLKGEAYYGKRKGTIDGNRAVGLKVFRTYPGQVSPEYTTKVWNNHVYRYIPEKYTWYEAKDYGTPLVTINSAEEEQFIRSFTDNATIWIGATDIEAEGKWKWLSGDSFTYSNWKNGDPDNCINNDEGSENYAILGSDGKWKDSCGCEKYGYVTEIIPAISFRNVYAVLLGDEDVDGNPKDQTISQGETATFTVYAIDNWNEYDLFGKKLKYSWQYKEVGMNSWKDWPSETDSNLSVDYAPNRDGMKVRCVVTDPTTGCQAVSKEAVLTCECVLTINEQPVSNTVNENELAYFSVKATGNGLKYLWQYKNAGASTWTDWTSKTTASISVAYLASRNGMSLRCVVTDSKGNKVISNVATLTYKSSLKITTQPENTTVNSGELAYFTVKASGKGLKYLWQYKNKGDSSWTNWTSKTTASISIAYAASRDGMSLRCVVTDSEGNKATSNAAVITYKAVSNLAITTQPENTTVNSGELAYFSVKASGSGLKYLWQYKNKGASSWTDWTSKTTASISVAYAASRNGMSIRCVVSDNTGNKATSNAATLTYKANNTLTITKQPSNANVNEGELAYFEVTATGSGLKYLWQYKNKGESSWTDWTSKTTAKISVAYAASRNGMSLRCIVTDSNSNKVTSNTVTLTYKANNTPVITTQPKNTTVGKNELAYFSVKATGTGLKYQWQYKNAGESSWTNWSSKTTADISVAYAAYRNGMSLRCVITDSKGNIIFSNTATLSYK